MSTLNALVVVAIIWLLIGLVTAFVMRRRGHDFWIWLVMGSILGPLAIPLAVERARFHDIEYESPDAELTPGRFDLLAGLDGSDEALHLFGDSVSSLTLATVLDFDSGGSYTGEDAQKRATRRLEEVAARIQFDPIRTALLFGRPDQALVEHAEDNEIEMIVVGARGQGLAETLFGSVTRRLVGGQAIPVFVGPRIGDLAVGRGKAQRIARGDNA